MKNKGLIYVLLIVVAVIWYNVFYRVVSNLNENETTLLESNAIKPTVKTIDRDTFKINANYRDPFGGTSVVLNNDLYNESIPEIRLSVPKQKQRIQWPIVEYKGLVRKTDSPNPLAIIYIDGIQLHMRKGESVFDGILLKNIGRDSVVITYKKEKRVFWRD
ncbi:MAG: hypothetical protein K9G40_00210 [Crocinitomicaceae bacterium]|nr:hypothetical protein [Crocinitomicaceae bacterium]MCF8434365.1 hypothetical protein [Crocinitomicaceae bacterium]